MSSPKNIAVLFDTHGSRPCINYWISLPLPCRPAATQVPHDLVPTPVTRLLGEEPLLMLPQRPLSAQRRAAPAEGLQGRPASATAAEPASRWAGVWGIKLIGHVHVSCNHWWLCYCCAPVPLTWAFCWATCSLRGTKSFLTVHVTIAAARSQDCRADPCLASQSERPCLQAGSGSCWGRPDTARTGGAWAAQLCSVSLLPNPSAAGESHLQQQGWQGPVWFCSQPGS